MGSVADNAENVTQNQNFIYFAVGFSFISRTTNNLKLEIRLDSMQKNSKSTEMVNNSNLLLFADRQCRRLPHQKTPRITSRNT